jgi:hypothetical protein
MERAAFRNEDQWKQYRDNWNTFRDEIARKDLRARDLPYFWGPETSDSQIYKLLADKLHAWAFSAITHYGKTVDQSINAIIALAKEFKGRARFQRPDTREILEVLEGCRTRIQGHPRGKEVPHFLPAS